MLDAEFGRPYGGRRWSGRTADVGGAQCWRLNMQDRVGKGIAFPSVTI